MTLPIADSLRELLGILKKQYLNGAQEHGGTADGFRQMVGKHYHAHPDIFHKLAFEATMEAATKKWQEPPRKNGPDLFEIDKVPVTEYLTRLAHGVYGVGDDDDGDMYEKVDSQFATVNDLYEDATIKMRKSAQAAAAAERQMRSADEARRRAGGRMDVRLRDLADDRL